MICLIHRYPAEIRIVNLARLGGCQFGCKIFARVNQLAGPQIDLYGLPAQVFLGRRLEAPRQPVAQCQRLAEAPRILPVETGRVVPGKIDQVGAKRLRL